MQNPQTDLPCIISQQLLTTNVDAQKRCLERYFTEDCVFLHPWTILKGRKEVGAIYELWARQNWNLKADVHCVWWNPEHQRAVVELTQTFTSKYILGINRTVRVVAILNLQQVPSETPEESKGEGVGEKEGVGVDSDEHERAPLISSSEEVKKGIMAASGRNTGMWVISCQEDFYTTYTILPTIISTPGRSAPIQALSVENIIRTVLRVGGWLWVMGLLMVARVHDLVVEPLRRPFPRLW
ncbi:hypothetical protein HK102_002487 [Quaeritorhiza haematococci]|nr:hypothetical protein HK102_002487 [Quaeritorhiza haematococci]